ncbi:MAG: hypothetical protein ACOCWR_00110 [Oceanidesulfovibrio sp.]
MTFRNDDERLLERVEAKARERAHAGLDGLVGGLESVIINVEPDHIKPAVDEFLRYTGLDFAEAFQGPERTTCVLGVEGGADFLLTCRNAGDNPFLPYNDRPKTRAMPNARLETFVYTCRDLATYVDIQKKRGIRFLTDDIIRTSEYIFIQTCPSPYTGNSLGFVEWLHKEGAYCVEQAKPLEWFFQKPDLPHLKNILELDHTATRVKAEERDDAILEFMDLTNYDFDFAVYVKSLNSITNVARMTREDYAQVFTSGIEPFVDVSSSGPTEKFIHNYGLRVHHMAFRTENIEETYAALGDDGMEFLVELVGSREDGLKQTFTVGSPHTFLVNEYIHRYDGFDGFFTKSNVTDLTRATDKQ